MQNINTRNRQVILGSDTLDSKLAVIDAYYGDFVGVLLKHLSHNVVSFTTNKDLSKNDILMWGHYTGISRGVKLKFNFVQSNMANHLTRVRYEDLQEVNNEGELSQALFRKTKQWKYEQEYRAIRTDDNKMNFESNTLEEITFGYNVGKEDRDTLIKTVKHLRIFPNCQFFRIAFKKGKLIKAQIHIDEFKAEQNVVVSFRIIETVK
ncbi:MAG: hypothetical protein IPL74_05635 [Bacteroidetes bacterium]|nr:hypothetical protein [Bacteroidota bacterium]